MSDSTTPETGTIAWTDLTVPLPAVSGDQKMKSPST
jgi:hypothetical protein